MSKADACSGGGWTTFNVWDRDEDQPGSSLLNSKAPEKDPKFHRSTPWNLQLLPLFPPPKNPSWGWVRGRDGTGSQEHAQRASFILRCWESGRTAGAFANYNSASAMYFWDAEMSFCSRAGRHGWGWKVALVVKNPPANAIDMKDVGLIPGLRRSLGDGNGNPLQYSCQGNARGAFPRGACWATVHGITESDMTEAT